MPKFSESAVYSKSLSLTAKSFSRNPAGHKAPPYRANQKNCAKQTLHKDEFIRKRLLIPKKLILIRRAAACCCRLHFLFTFLKRKVKPKNFIIKGGCSTFVTLYLFLKHPPLLISAGDKPPPYRANQKNCAKQTLHKDEFIRKRLLIPKKLILTRRAAACCCRGRKRLIFCKGYSFAKACLSPNKTLKKNCVRNMHRNNAF